MATSLPPLDSIAARVRYVRELSGLKAHELSAAARLAQGHVGMIERGTVEEPTNDTLKKIAAATGVPWLWLLTGEGDDPNAVAVHAAAHDAHARSKTTPKREVA